MTTIENRSPLWESRTNGYMQTLTSTSRVLVEDRSEAVEQHPISSHKDSITSTARIALSSRTYSRNVHRVLIQAMEILTSKIRLLALLQISRKCPRQYCRCREAVTRSIQPSKGRSTQQTYKTYLNSAQEPSKATRSSSNQRPLTIMKRTCPGSVRNI